MAKYTTELRTICENIYGATTPQGYDKVAEIIAAAKDEIFSFDYPIFDESYRSILETKIIKHFYLREIGLETYGLFKLQLDAKMNEIMPYYNQLYNSELLEFNPLYEVDYTTTHQGSDSGEKSGSETNDFTRNLGHSLNETNQASGADAATGSVNSRLGGTDRTTQTEVLEIKNHNTGNNSNGTESDVAQANNTPQGGLPADYLNSTMYLTAWTKNDKTNSLQQTGTETRRDENSRTDATTYGKTDNQTNTNEITYGKRDTKNASGTETGTTKTERETGEEFSNMNQYTDHVVGRNSKTAASMIKEFRETFLNIDMMIIDDLNDLFMLVY